MAGFRFITRGNSSPQGKPRVYFCSHPADRELYLAIVAQEILENVNCAIWYESNSSVNNPDNMQTSREDSISQMQLLVVPITSRLLLTPNEAMDEDIPFALNAHIPVLALMRERGIEELFEKRFGTIQFLSNLDHDPTAVAYDEKLKRYLNSVLIGDELAARVRSAFVGRIFLSYRKRDRSVAQMIMGRIHHDVACQDIAIWYDEYLIPGEHFDKAISKEISECDLFVLVVTPHILEQPNYVLDCEYPRARKLLKSILPIEGEQTERMELDQLYVNLPPCVDGNDCAAISREIRRIIETPTPSSYEKGPEHDYLIGLAYLGGIDVEVSPTRAVKLISSAADAGLPEAIERLALMYENGEAVERNYRAGALQRERLAEIRGRQWELSSTEHALEQYLDALKGVAGAYQSMNDLSSAKKWISLHLSILEQTSTAHAKGQHAHDIILDYVKLGSIYEERGLLCEALGWFESAHKAAQTVYEESHRTVESTRGLAIVYECLGSLALKMDNVLEACSWFDQRLRLTKQICGKKDSAGNRNLLASAYLDMSESLRRNNRLDAARSSIESALDLIEQISEETKSPDDRLNLAIAYSSLGKIQLNQGELLAARESFLSSSEIVEELVEQTDSYYPHSAQVGIFILLALVEKEFGNLAKARSWLEKGDVALDELLFSVDPSSVRSHLENIYFLLASITARQGDFESSHKWTKKLATVEPLLRNSLERREHQSSLAQVLAIQGESAEYRGWFSLAREHYEKSARLFEQLAKQDTSPENLCSLSRIRQSLAHLALSERKLITAASFWVESFPPLIIACCTALTRRG